MEKQKYEILYNRTSSSRSKCSYPSHNYCSIPLYQMRFGDDIIKATFSKFCIHA